MDILSDVNIIGKLEIGNTRYGSNNIFMQVWNSAYVRGNICAESLTLRGGIYTIGGACFNDDVRVAKCLSLGDSYLTKTISVPAQCTRFLINEYYRTGSEGEEESNNKYPLVTAYRGAKKVDMDVEMDYRRQSGATDYTEFVVGNITSCSSPMTLKVSMLG